MENQRRFQDMSRKVATLAREIDRLPPGNYTIVLEKPENKIEPWKAHIEGAEIIRDMFLSRDCTQ